MRTTFPRLSSLGCRRVRPATDGIYGNTRTESGEIKKKSSALTEGQNRHFQRRHHPPQPAYDGNRPIGSINPPALHLRHGGGPNSTKNYAGSSAAVPVNESAQSEIDLTQLPQQHTIDEQIQPVEGDLSPVPGRRDFTILESMGAPDINAGALVPDQNDSMEYHKPYTCPHLNCRSKQTGFNRKYELQRHMQKHSRNQSYGCPVINCVFQGENAPYRPDKLKSHLRAHQDDSLCFCPVPGCSVRIMTLHLTSEHLGFHTVDELSSTPNGAIIRDYRKERSLAVLKCPIGLTKACSKWMKREKLSAHILGHPEQERSRRRDEAFGLGYDSISGQLACPICRVILRSQKAFSQHIHMFHLNDQPGRDHIEACLTAINPAKSTSAHHHGQYRWMDDWKKDHMSELPPCPLCPGIKLLTEWRYNNHHLLIQKNDISEVIQHRQQILRHYPDFINHPSLMAFASLLLGKRVPGRIDYRTGISSMSAIAVAWIFLSNSVFAGP